MRWHYPLINYLTHLIVFWRLCSVEAVLGQQQLQHSGLQPLQCSSTWLATPASVWCRTAHWYQMSKICQKIISLVSCDFTIFFLQFKFYIIFRFRWLLGLHIQTLVKLLGAWLWSVNFPIRKKFSTCDFMNFLQATFSFLHHFDIISVSGDWMHFTFEKLIKLLQTEVWSIYFTIFLQIFVH